MSQQNKERKGVKEGDRNGKRELETKTETDRFSYTTGQLCVRLAYWFPSPTNSHSHMCMHSLTLTHTPAPTPTDSPTHTHTEAHSHSGYESCSAQS